jgi:hypothetical protein
MPASTWRTVIPAVMEEVARGAQRLAGVLWRTHQDAAAGLDDFALRMFEESERRERPRALRQEEDAFEAPLAAAAPPPMAFAAEPRSAPAAAMAGSHAKAGDSMAVRVLVDARVAEAAGIDPDSVSALRHYADEPLTVQARVTGPPGQIWARVWQRDGEILYASGRLTGTGVATARLPLPRGVGAGMLELDLVEDPRAARVRDDSVGLAEAWRAGWQALAAERTQGGAAVPRAWAAAASAWRELGDSDRTALALSYGGETVEPTLRRQVAWAGPLLDLQREQADAFLHERVVWRPPPPPSPGRGRRGGRGPSGRGWQGPEDDWDPRDFL